MLLWFLAHFAAFVINEFLTEDVVDWYYLELDNTVGPIGEAQLEELVLSTDSPRRDCPTIRSAKQPELHSARGALRKNYTK